jgi:hypothetical protein
MTIRISADFSSFIVVTDDGKVETVSLNQVPAFVADPGYRLDRPEEPR